MDLDRVQSHASFANTICKVELEKWELVVAISDRHLRLHRDGVVQVSKFAIPKTRNSCVDYCPGIKPGMFGKLVSGKERDLFVPLEDSGQNNSALVSYQSDIWLRDRNEAPCEVAREKPRVYDFLSFNMHLR